MPGRLGDDPLSRKRAPSKQDAPSAGPGIAAQQTSHNDVFFRRRTENTQPIPESAPEKQLQILGEATDAGERPEITEVADLVRTARDAEIAQGAEQLSRLVSLAEPPHPSVEETARKPEQEHLPVLEPARAIEPPPPVVEERAAAVSSLPDAQPQKSEGFFKRLFGRFGK
ncbi:MAG TPA: hypothetical protein VLU91_07610 [Nitrososphaerales archaeon]|nr:hypothetical protein [Nitrososphaerales archaeon]